VGVGGFRGGDELVMGGVGAAGPDVVSDGAIEQQSFLQDDGDVGA
jgi:hypothetical protein